jgi:8-oxo-dGTP pyrophosphatase MutT (NUDIX family)
VSNKELSKPPPPTLTGLAFVRNRAGEVLLIDKKGKSADPDRWSLPGGTIGYGDEGPIACQRWLRAQTGLRLVPDRLLVVHQMPTDNLIPNGVSFFYNTERRIGGEQITLDGEELESYRWVHPVYVSGYVAPYMAWCIRCALDAVDSGAPTRFLCGHPDQEKWNELAA